MFHAQGFIDFHKKSKKPTLLSFLRSMHKQNQQPLAKKLFSDLTGPRICIIILSRRPARDPYLDGTVTKQSHAVNPTAQKPNYCIC